LVQFLRAALSDGDPDVVALLLSRDDAEALECLRRLRAELGIAEEAATPRSRGDGQEGEP
jgi:5-enolpyruvylshikimate-3-phosphate synthase